MTQSFSFNLVDEPWIPCQWRESGEIEDLSLRQTLLHAHELLFIDGEVPPITAALYRLLLAILHDEFGPKNRDAWRELWAGEQWNSERVNRYLDENKPFFDLFDPERPFYQVAGMDKVENPAIRLLHHINSPTLFEHTLNDSGSFSPSQAARGLVSLQSFALAQGPPVRPAYDSTWTRDVIFVLKGSNLFETLMLNLIAYPYQRPIPTTPGDMPVWRMADPFKLKRSKPLGYLDYLTWQNRQIWLRPEIENEAVVVKRMMVLPGYKLEMEITTPDPFKLYFLDRKDGSYNAHRFTKDRSLWRDSVSLFSVHKIPKADESPNMIPPYTFRWVYGFREELARMGQIYQYDALGMATDRPPQNKVFFYRHEHMPLPLDYLEDEKLVHILQECMATAERAASELRWSTRKLAVLIHYPEMEEKLWKFVTQKVIESGIRAVLWEKLIKPQATKEKAKSVAKVVTDKWGIGRNYWAELENPFIRLTLDLPGNSDIAIQKWEKSIQFSARSAFNLAREFAGTSPKALRAIAISEQELNLGLHFTMHHLTPDTKEA